jgi:hypothetical protein
LNSLYKIITKDGTVETLRLNAAQQKLLAQMHNRVVIVKARQLGVTTLLAILWLDECLFSASPVQCAIIAHRKPDAEKIFKKIRFAYDSLPPELRAMFPLASDSASELSFKHNHASIKVDTSVRSDTIHRLHISEYAKLCAQFPARALEVRTGAMQAVPGNGTIVIESTAEGAEGHFHDIATRAIELAQSGKAPRQDDYRLVFFPWFEDPAYVRDADDGAVSERMNEYFDRAQMEARATISPAQRAWYAAKMAGDFGGDQAMMFQEYPTTVDEAFRVSVEGCYYTRELALARTQGRVCKIPLLDNVPVNTFWDFGHSGRNDATTLWLHQRVAAEHRFLAAHEFELGATIADYARWLQACGYVYGTHYLPHDADHKLLGSDPDKNRSIMEMLQDAMPGQRFEIVPRITEINTGIQATRNMFPSCWFDEDGCADGLRALANYRREWDEKRGVWTNKPRHDDASHFADALRQFGQVADNGEAFRQRAAEGRARLPWRAARRVHGVL